MNLTKIFSVSYAKETPYTEWVELNKPTIKKIGYEGKEDEVYFLLTGKKPVIEKPKKEVEKPTKNKK